MAHNCQFSLATRKYQQPNDARMSAAKETPSAASSSSVSGSQDGATQATDSTSAMHMLGYMYEKNDAIFGSITRNTEYTDSSDSLPDPVLKASRAVPPRPYTDMLVKNFFDSVNYHYGILHQPSFMIVYVDWWSHRREVQSLRNSSTVALTCLILRICANSTQFLSPQNSSQLESDLGDSVRDLSKSYHEAAQTISGFLSPERTGAEISSENMMLLHQIVDISLKAMSVSKDTFDLCFPQQAKYYMVAFCPFDNAAFLCSLLIHDVDGTMVPRRAEVVQAVGQALHIAHRLRGFTKMGDTTWSILSTLKSRITLYPLERELIEETESTGTQLAKDGVELGVDSFHHSKLNDQFQSILDEDLRFVENTLATDSAEFLEMDLGILDGVWNWDRVGF
ncbi:hypothetical protein TrVGV298_004833 [Trichoderma virens]|nr:hypothetical protein TrVGV298_004833 [Trichoderma virens]